MPTNTDATARLKGGVNLLQLLLGAEVARVSALFLATISGTRVKASVTLAAYHLVAVVFLGQDAERWLDDATSQTQNQV